MPQRGGGTGGVRQRPGGWNQRAGLLRSLLPVTRRGFLGRSLHVVPIFLWKDEPTWTGVGACTNSLYRLYRQVPFPYIASAFAA